MSKHHRRSMSLALHSSEILIRLHLPFQSLSKKKENNAVPYVCYICRIAFITVLLYFCFLVCEHGENSKLLFHFKHFYICFRRRFQFPGLPHATNVYLSAWKRWRKVNYRTTSHHLRPNVRVCTSWMCVRRSSSRSQRLCVSGTWPCSITSSIIQLLLDEASTSASPETVLPR